MKEVQIDRVHRLWIYKPTALKGKAPLVLIAPAGSPLVVGMDLSEGDIAEEVPYAQAGCIVVAYDVSGPSRNGRALTPAVRAFMDAKAGTTDGSRALDYALKNLPEVDPNRVIAAGHSSAATLALQMAAFDPRVRACIAYAPAVDVPACVRPNLPEIESAVPGFTDFITRYSPSSNEKLIHVPLFLFHADDDKVVPRDQVRALARAVPTADLAEVESGGHYNSMLEIGIPTAVRWLKDHNLAAG